MIEILVTDELIEWMKSQFPLAHNNWLNQFAGLFIQAIKDKAVISVGFHACFQPIENHDLIENEDAIFWVKYPDGNEDFIKGYYSTGPIGIGPLIIDYAADESYYTKDDNYQDEFDGGRITHYSRVLNPEARCPASLSIGRKNNG